MSRLRVLGRQRHQAGAALGLRSRAKRAGPRVSDCQHSEDGLIPHLSKEEALRLVCRNGRHLELGHGRSVSWSSHWENCWQLLLKLEVRIPRAPGRPLGGASLTEMRREA